MVKIAQSLRFRLMLLVLLSMLPALILVLYSDLEQRNLAAEQAKGEALRLSRLVTSNQVALIEGANQLLTGIASVPVALTGSPEECSQFLGELHRQYPNYANLSIARPDGLLECSSQPLPSVVYVNDRSYFQEALAAKDLVVGDFSIGQVTGTPILPIAHPILDDKGIVIAVIIASIDLTWLSTLVSDLDLPADSTVLVIDRTGIVLSSHPSPEEWIGKSYPQSPLIQAMSDRREDTIESVGIDGTNRLFGYTPLEYESKFIAHVAVGIPTSFAYAEADRTLARNAISLTAVTVLALISAWVASDAFVLRQVNALLAATNRLSSGELEARTGLDYSSGELGALAHSFDQMAAALQDRERQIRTAEARYRALVENLPAIVYTTLPGKSGKTIYISPQVEPILGYSAAEWLGAGDLWETNIHPDDRQAMLAELARTRQNNAAFQVEYRWHHRRGNWIWLRDEAVTVLDSDGLPAFRQGIMIDITKMKQVEAELEEYTVQLERSNRELQDFAYIASHDLQEPLRKIQAFGERLQNRSAEDLDETGKTYIERMRDAAARMQTLINDLLSYSRISSRAKPFDFIDLNQIAADVIVDLEQSIRDANGQVQVGELPGIEADASQIRQLFQNLIANSLKFRKFDVPAVVKVYAAPVSKDGNRFPSFAGDWSPENHSDNRVEIRVADNGIGFDEKYLDRIFNPFQRLHPRDVYSGSGIGLAICRKIVNRHHGSITAVSTPGEGSTFIITLPIRQPKPSSGENL